jgi:hypothetical protein
VIKDTPISEDTFFIVHTRNISAKTNTYEVRQLKNPDEVLNSLTANEKSSTRASGITDWTHLTAPYVHYVPKSTERDNLNFLTDTIAFFPNNSNDPIIMNVSNEGEKSSLMLIDPEKLE